MTLRPFASLTRCAHLARRQSLCISRGTSPTTPCSNSRVRLSAGLGIVRTGFVAGPLHAFAKNLPDLKVVAATDINQTGLAAFCEQWGVHAAPNLQQMLNGGVGAPDLILNLTNPNAHFNVSRACLEAGKHVYSEKPLAMTIDDARSLCSLAESRGLMLASAPCSILGETAQTLWLALRRNEIGKPRLIYAELDDDFVSQAPYRKWRSESGAPWPFRDEFTVGCTLEHAGYYLTWLMAMFGSVSKVVAASASVVTNKLGDGVETAPDFSCATLFRIGIGRAAHLQHRRTPRPQHADHRRHWNFGG